MKKRELHVVTTGTQDDQQLIDIIKKIHPYVDYIHLREKHRSAKEIYDLINQLLNQRIPLSKLMINDRVDLAQVLGVKGVQLPNHALPVRKVKESFPELRIGASVHSTDEARIAEEEGADFLLYGHIFPTNCKRNLPPKGVKNLQYMTSTVSKPVMAIGGIKPDDVKAVLDCGAAGIAVMSKVFLANDPLDAVQHYKREIVNWEGWESGK
ncbi:thiazole tautomerase TenI [Salirhabdus salicampi]|uniref:thiazole tautomerase TenI n=1 Tax=Salirhabdus salicampi TaxID=476102 RepID=UPI0020C1D7ED|nr:thiazole tautomerase TenI [Salirhabdus salicampi]